MFAFLQATILCTMMFRMVLGTAPGDETCPLQSHASDVDVLMDSFHYQSLLSTVWNALDIDGNGITVGCKFINIILLYTVYDLCDHSGHLVLVVRVNKRAPQMHQLPMLMIGSSLSSSARMFRPA